MNINTYTIDTEITATIVNMLLLLLYAHSALATLNFDPGLNIQLAAFYDPSSPHFFESCDASPTGRFYILQLHCFYISWQLYYVFLYFM